MSLKTFQVRHFWRCLQTGDQSGPEFASKETGNPLQHRTLPQSSSCKLTLSCASQSLRIHGGARHWRLGAPAHFLALHFASPFALGNNSVVVTVRCIQLVLNEPGQDDRSPDQIQPSARPAVDVRDTLGFGPAVVTSPWNCGNWCGPTISFDVRLSHRVEPSKPAGTVETLWTNGSSSEESPRFTWRTAPKLAGSVVGSGNST